MVDLDALETLVARLDRIAGTGNARATFSVLSGALAEVVAELVDNRTERLRLAAMLRASNARIAELEAKGAVPAPAVPQDAEPTPVVEVDEAVIEMMAEPAEITADSDESPHRRKGRKGA